MKSRHIFLIIIPVLAALLSSCEDYLVRTPPLESSNESALSTYDGLAAATNAAYAPLYSSNWYGRGFIVTADLKGGNSKASPINTGRFRYEYTWTNNASYTSNLWAAAYQAITRACNVLEYAELLNDPDVDEDDLNQLKGECFFIRALGHFDLVRMYAQPYSFDKNGPGVPIILKTEVDYPTRATVAEVYDRIVKDLEDATGLMSTTPRQGGSQAAMASKNAALALLAKASLYMEEWQDAADYASQVIDGGYVLYDSAACLTVWGQNDQSEVIFEVFGKDGQEYYPGFDEIGYIYSPDGYGDVCATNDLLSLFGDGDVRKQLFMGHASYPGYYWPVKYPGKAHIRENNIPVLRLSEMYLIRAESALKGATGYDPLGDLNAIREHRGLADASSVTLQEIYDERRRELCFEGNALWDLSRTGRSLNRDETEITITEKDNIDIAFPDNRWAMPIPVRETDVNKNLEQNPT